MREWVKNVWAGVEKEAWIRFFLAIAGLALAFAAALFSTLTRQEGNLLATAFLASGALLLAGFVGLTTVPYLARKVALHRVREAFDYEVTREGLVYMGLILLIGVAALNTGNNLLFIVVAAMLSAVLVSGAASAMVLRALELEVSLPEHVFAGDSVLGRVVLRNQRRWLPSFSVTVVPPRERKPGKRLRWERATFSFPPNRKEREPWLRLPDMAVRVVQELRQPKGILRQRVYFPYVPPRTSLGREVELSFPRRGRYAQDSFGLATRFPFSFLVKTRRIELAREVIVYPRVQPTDELFEVLPLITGEFESFVRGRGHDLYRIREYMPEDSARHVDWKSSARTGSLKVREFTREDERKLRLVFDNPAAGITPEAQYERGVEMAASVAWHFAGEDTELSFAAAGYGGSADVYEFLRYLALVQPQKEPGRSVLDELEVTDDYNVIFTPRARGSIPTALWACSYFLFFGEMK